jgi:NADH-quinone oxidoreductase subunit H
MLRELFYFLVFPGLLFSGVAGGLLSWFDRKITARVQFRKGPPLLQPFYDFFKLIYKETIIPKHGTPAMFLLAPVISLTAAVLAGVMILLPLFGIRSGFSGDIIVIFYLLSVPSMFFVIGAMASGNPLASVGASREIKLIMSYELAFLLLVAAVIYKSGYKISLYDIIAVQQSGTAFIAAPSGILLFIVAIFCLQAKLGYVPFDMAEAETEITHGMFIEYSGTPYALIKLTKYILLFVLPAFVIAILLGGMHFSGIDILWSVLKLLGIVLLITLIRNTNPRLKIRQAVRFFLIGINTVVLVAIVLSYFGW